MPAWAKAEPATTWASDQVDEGDQIVWRQRSVSLATLIGWLAFCGSGTDNKVAIGSDRYDTNPLTIQGPGAGAEVTAAALLDDVLKFA